MNSNMKSEQRRDFLKASALLAGGAMLSSIPLAGAYAAGSDVMYKPRAGGRAVAEPKLNTALVPCAEVKHLVADRELSRGRATCAQNDVSDKLCALSAAVRPP